MCPALLAVHEHMNAYGPSYSSFLGSYQLVKHDFILIQLGFKVYRLNTCTVCLYCIHVSRYCIYSTTTVQSGYVQYFCIYTYARW